MLEGSINPTRKEKENFRIYIGSVKNCTFFKNNIEFIQSNHCVWRDQNRFTR